jgi:hypothetical protein
LRHMTHEGVPRRFAHGIGDLQRFAGMRAHRTRIEDGAAAP